jgi:hypothetical protein
MASAGASGSAALWRFEIARVLVRLDHVALTDFTHFRIFPRNLQPELYALPSVSRHTAEVSATKRKEA